MSVEVGQTFRVLVEGGIVAAEIFNIRQPNNDGIDNYLIETRYAGSPDALPSLIVSSEEWPLLTLSDVEARYRDVMRRAGYYRRIA